MNEKNLTWLNKKENNRPRSPTSRLFLHRDSRQVFINRKVLGDQVWSIRRIYNQMSKSSLRVYLCWSDSVAAIKLFFIIYFLLVIAFFFLFFIIINSDRSRFRISKLSAEWFFLPLISLDFIYKFGKYLCSYYSNIRIFWK